MSVKECDAAFQALRNESKKPDFKFEARFGSFDGSRFVPFVSEIQYTHVFENLQREGWPVTTQLKDTIKKLENSKIRKIGAGLRTTWKKEINFKNIYGLSCRFSESEDVSSQKLPISHDIDSAPNEYIAFQNFDKSILIHMMKNHGRCILEIESKANICPLVTAVSDWIAKKASVLEQFKKMVVSSESLRENWRGVFRKVESIDDKNALPSSSLAVTEKKDAARPVLLFIDSNGSCHLISLISKEFKIKNWHKKHPSHANTIIEGEISHQTFFTSDLLFWHGEDMSSFHLGRRLFVLRGMDEDDFIKHKVFKFPNLDDPNISEQISEVWKNRRRHTNDVMFLSIDSFLQTKIFLLNDGKAFQDLKEKAGTNQEFIPQHVSAGIEEYETNFAKIADFQQSKNDDSFSLETNDSGAVAKGQLLAILSKINR